MVGTYGVYRSYLPHVQAVMHALANGYSENFDFLNFHDYAHGGDPRLSSSDHPSFDTEWQAIHAVFPTRPIWVTEVGWTTKPLAGIQPVSPQTQATYLQYVSQEAAASGGYTAYILVHDPITATSQIPFTHPQDPFPRTMLSRVSSMQNPLWN